MENTWNLLGKQALITGSTTGIRFCYCRRNGKTWGEYYNSITQPGDGLENS